MKKGLLYILMAASFCHTLNAQAQDLVKQYEQLYIGKTVPGDSVRIYIEYPEYEKLGIQEIRKLKKSGFVPKSEIEFQTVFSVSKGDVIADVAFVPVIKRNGSWLRLKGYSLKSQLISTKCTLASRQTVLNEIKKQRTERYAAHSVLSSGRWVKIRVEKEGLYQLTDNLLSKMGFKDPSRVKLFGYGGRMLPETLPFTGPEALIDDLNEVPLYRRAGSYVFFAEGLVRWINKTQFSNNVYSKYSYYFLTEGDNPEGWTTLSSVGGNALQIEQVPAYALFDNDEFIWYGGGRDFYDSRDTQGAPIYELSLPGNVGEEQVVAYDFAVKASQVTTRASITQLSDQSKGANVILQHGDELARGYRGTFRTRMGEKEKFQIKTSNTGRLNYIYTSYTQHLSVKYTTHAFTPHKDGAVSLVVDDANENIRVWQLGDAKQNVAELPGELQGSKYIAKSPNGMARFAIVDITRQYPEPQIVGEIQNQDLHADASLDYIMIVPASGKLVEQAERLAESHRNNGLRVKVVRADQIYNEFSSGTPDATAYRRYMKMLYDRATNEQDAPKYLLLFGDCSYDNRMVTPEYRRSNPNDYLLSYERSDNEDVMNNHYPIGTMNDYVTDDYYAFLDDGEGVDIYNDKMDLSVGRFPCHTPSDAEWLVNNTLSYMRNEHVGAWKNRMWAIGDVGDENLHMHDALDVSGVVLKYANPGFLLRYNFPDVYTITAETKGATYPEATQNLKRSMKNGALIFNYNGHGNPDRLSHQFLLDKADMKTNVSNSLPVWIFASCEITPYDQNIESLGLNALYSRTGSSVAVVCAARSVYANYNRLLNMGFVKYAFSKNKENKRYTLGDALRLTKKDLKPESGIRGMVNKLKYVLLGDPAIALSYPDSGVKVDSVNRTPVVSSDLIQLPIGDKVRFSGYVHSTSEEKPDTSFNGTLTGSVYTPKRLISCKGYGNKYSDPLQFEDYTQLLFEGSVEVKKGRFDLEFMVPRGISFSTDKALLSLYSVDENTHREYNGCYDNFCFNGFSQNQQIDSIGPSVYMYMNTPDFPNGAVVTPNPTLYVSVADTSALSMVSGNMGHDMELWLDDDMSTLQVVNDYFSFDYGSYQKGFVEYPMSGLQPGRHKLNFRVWDVFDNSSLARLDFIVSEAETTGFDVMANTSFSGQIRFITKLEAPVESNTDVTLEVYNIAGYRVWHSTSTVNAGDSYAVSDWNRTDYSGNKLERGVYLYRSKANKKETDTKKLIF